MIPAEMTKPLDKFKKLKGRSWDEIRTRGSQAVSGYSEQIGLTGKLPSDSEFKNLINPADLTDENFTAESLLEKFYENSLESFFPSMAENEKTLDLYRERFGEDAIRFVIEKADMLVRGKFDLLGFLNLDLGAEVDWHFEPVSGKHSPLKHWKQFDELGTRETGDKKIIWELNRHQHFFTLGIAFRLTGDERYAETFARHLEGWMRQNPPGVGINWFSSLEDRFSFDVVDLGVSFFQRFKTFYVRTVSESLEISLSARAAHRKISFDLLQSEHASDGRSPRSLLSRNAVSVFQTRRQSGAKRARKFSLPNSTGRFWMTAFISSRRPGISVTRRIFTRIFLF